MEHVLTGHRPVVFGSGLRGGGEVVKVEVGVNLAYDKLLGDEGPFVFSSSVSIYPQVLWQRIGHLAPRCLCFPTKENVRSNEAPKILAVASEIQGDYVERAAADLSGF